MLKMKPGDAIFSYKGTKLVSLGIVKSNAYTETIPKDHAVKNQWAQDGWKVDVEYNELSKKIRPKDHFEILVPLLPEEHGPLDVNGDGNQAYLFELPHKLAEQLVDIIGHEAALLVSCLDNASSSDIQSLAASLEQQAHTGDTSVKTLIQARRGHGIYKKNLLQIETRCRITGVTEVQHLVASHIKPWKDSNNQEKVDGNNGLLLSPHIDRLFDKGHISFEDNGDLIIGKTVSTETQRAWSILAGNYGDFNKLQKYYLDYHRHEIYAIRQSD
jgi:putative restriction endonuclease